MDEPDVEAKARLCLVDACMDCKCLSTSMMVPPVVVVPHFLFVACKSKTKYLVILYAICIMFECGAFYVNGS